MVSISARKKKEHCSTDAPFKMWQQAHYGCHHPAGLANRCRAAEALPPLEERAQQILALNPEEILRLSSAKTISSSVMQRFLAVRRLFRPRMGVPSMTLPSRSQRIETNRLWARLDRH
jgi:hypothetical protein